MRSVAIVFIAFACVAPDKPAATPAPAVAVHPAPPLVAPPPLLVAPPIGKPLEPFVTVSAATVVLQHVHVIDGTGAAGKDDQAGSDPTGYGAAVAGFADQRQLELLVEAGFSVPEAIRIASGNGATFLGVGDQIGTLAAGKRADLVIVKGNPEQQVKDVEQVELVFKDGVGYDPAKLIGSVTGTVGLH